VDPALPLDKAQEIVRYVEQSSVPKLRQVTVHLEPSIPETAEGTLVDDEYLPTTIRSVTGGYPGVREISAIATYRAQGKLYFNVHCLLSGETPISEIHEMISRIEESIRRKFDDAIVTIHPEPAER